MPDETPYISRRERRHAAEQALAESTTPPPKTDRAPGASLMEPEFAPAVAAPAPFVRPEPAVTAAPEVSSQAEPDVPTAVQPLAVLGQWADDAPVTPAEPVDEDAWVVEPDAEGAAPVQPATIKLGWEAEPAAEVDDENEAEAEADSASKKVGRRQKRESKPRLTRKERKAERRANRRWWRPIVEFVAIVIAAALLAALLKAVAFRTFEVPSESMTPTLQISDRIVVELISPRFEPYKRGDVVVFKDPADWIGNGVDPDEYPNLLQLLGILPEQSGYIVKRILALPGETIEGREDGTLLINGEVFEDTYAAPTPQEPFTWVVPEGQYWMMGDNRAGSADSRVHGPVSGDEFVGRVAFKFFPFDRIGGLD